VGIVQAGTWGLAGGVVAGLISLSTAVVAANFRWPWRGRRDGIWPRLFVVTAGLLIGTIVAASAHGQITGEWPALIMGAAAPSLVRGVLSRIEVQEAKPSDGDHGPG
jgi:hypothetical protein